MLNIRELLLYILVFVVSTYNFLYMKKTIFLLIMILFRFSLFAEGLGILSSQVGYDAGETQQIYIRNNDSGFLNEKSHFKVVDLQDSCVFKGKFEDWGNLWKTNWWIAKLKIRKEGKYLLKFESNGKEFCSDTFKIEKNILWNECFSTITIDMLKERAQNTVTGKGWRDCGSDLQEFSSHVVTIDALCDIIENASQRLSTGEIEFIESEIIRGTDFLTHYQDLAKKKGLGEGAVVHESKQTDIVTGNVAKAAYIFVRMSRLIKHRSLEKSKEYLQRSLRAYNWIKKNGPIINNEEQKFFAAVHGAPNRSIPPAKQWMTRDLITMLRATLELYKAGETKYKVDAVSFAQKIMKRQVSVSENEDGLYGHFYLYDDFSSLDGIKVTEKANIHCGAWSKEGRIYNKGGHYPHYVLPFIEMTRLWPNHSEAPNWDRCLKNFAYGYFLPVTQKSPFNILPAGYYKSEGLLFFGNWYHAHNNMYAFAAVLALEFEQYFEDREFHKIAINNLQWIAGANCGWKEKEDSIYKSYSMIAGIGTRTKGSWTGIPGTICNGFSSSKQFRIEPISTETDLPIHFDDEGYIAHSLPFVAALVRLKDFEKER